MLKMDKHYKIKIKTCFYYFPEMSQTLLKRFTSINAGALNNSVANFQSLLFRILNISSPDYFAEFRREGFDVGDKLNADDKIEDGAIVFVNITCKRNKENYIDDVFYKQGGN